MTVATPTMETMMRALIQPKYGTADVLRFEDVALPTPGDDEVLVRVHAAAVCRGDVHLMTGKPYLIRTVFGLRKPKHRIAGQNVAGVAVAVGKSVTSVKPGDEVYGLVYGGFAEYLCARAELLAPKPASLDFEQAASLPDSGMTALQGLRDVGRLQAGQSLLINGASGGIGTFAVQIAKALGAEVTAVCSARNVAMVRALGADRVIDYESEDYAAGGARYDLIFDLVGNRSIADNKRALKPGGTYLPSTGSPGKRGGNWVRPITFMLKVKLAGVFGSRRTATFIAKPVRADLLALSELVAAGKLTPQIERRYGFAEAAEAVRHVAEGHARGKSVITVLAVKAGSSSR